MRRSSIWATLEIAATQDGAAIRRAYARRLKATNPEDDPEGFQALRAAYEQAMAMAAQAQADVQAEPDDSAGRDVETQAPSPRTPVDDAPAAEPEEEAPGVGRGEVAALQAAFNHLYGLIQAQAEPADIVAAFRVAMKSPALEAVILRDQAEYWVGSTILESAPLADALIEPAIAAFGWTEDHVGFEHTIAAAVMNHREVVRSLSRLERHPLALKVLARPPSFWRLWLYRLTPGLAEEVRGLLHWCPPHLLQDRTDPRTRQWWTRRLSRQPPVAEWVGGGLAAIAVMACFEASGVLGWASVLTTALVGLGFVLVATIAALACRGALLERLSGDWSTHDGPLARYGWAGLALLTLTAGATLPPSPGALAAVAVLGLGAWLWAVSLRHRGHDERPVERAASRFVLPFEGAVVLAYLPVFIYAFGLRENVADAPLWGQMTFGVLLTSAAFVSGHAQLRAAWDYAVSVPAKIAVLATLILIAAVTPLILWAASPGPAHVAPAAALAIAIALGHLPLTASRITGGVPWLFSLSTWFLTLLFGSVVGEVTDQGNIFLLFGGMWVLASATLSLLGVFRVTWAEAQRAREPGRRPKAARA